MKRRAARGGIACLAVVAVLAMACGEPVGMGPVTAGSSSSTWSGGVDSGSESSAGSEGNGPAPICVPGVQQCGASGAIETCDPTGFGWDLDPCQEHASCVSCVGDDDPACEGLAARCSGPCDVEGRTLGSEGCSFVAIRLLWESGTWEGPHTIIVGNPNETLHATVQLYLTPEGTRDEMAIGDPVRLDPGETTTWPIEEGAIMGTTSLLRTGGVYRVESTLPVVAQMYAPESPRPGRTNDSSLLLPEETFRETFVVPAFQPHPYPSRGPSYFSVVALEDDTELAWTPPVATFGNGAPIPAVAPGETGSVFLNRLDNLRVAAVNSSTNTPEERDLSGTVITASKPVAVFSGVKCVTIPHGFGSCDNLQEQLIPLDYWSNRYVGANAPPREPQYLIIGEPAEQHRYRLYAGSENVTVTLDPPLQGPFDLQGRGSWVEVVLDAGQDVVFEGDGAFMPVQYLQAGLSFRWFTGFPDIVEVDITTGDPAMVQSVPVEQWLERYSFVTGVDWEEEYAQLIRPAGAGEVFVDGVMVTPWRTVGEFEVADWLLDPTERSHVAEAGFAFGLTQFGYNGRIRDLDLDEDGFIGNVGDDMNASYAHPGGIRAETLFLP